MTENNVIEKKENHNELEQKEMRILDYLCGSKKVDLIKNLSSISKYIDPESAISFALNEYRTNKKLQNATTSSFLDALIKATNLGLKVGSSYGQVYLTAITNKKTQITTINVVLGYPGMITLLYRSGLISKIDTRVVYEKDEFLVEYGKEEKLIHKPNLVNRGEPIAYYASVLMKDGTFKFEVLTKEEVEKIRNESRQYKTLTAAEKEQSIWGKHFDSMAKGKTIRALCKTLSLLDSSTNLDLTKAIQDDEEYTSTETESVKSLEDRLIESESND